MNKRRPLVSLLIVQNARQAIDFSRGGLGAEVSACYEHGEKRHLGQAELVLPCGSLFSLSEEVHRLGFHSPPGPGGTPLILQLRVEDASLAWRGDAGARSGSPVQDLPRHSEPGTAKKATSIGRGLFRGQGPIQPTDPPKIHLVVGPVGAGKSTFARRLAEEQRAARFALDDWMATLFSADRPAQDVIEWYVERAERAVEQIWGTAQSILHLGTSVVLELGLLRRQQRREFYARADSVPHALTVHVLEADRAVRRERVIRRNAERGPTFSMYVPMEAFELASDLWEEPGEEECAQRDLRFVRTDTDLGDSSF